MFTEKTIVPAELRSTVKEEVYLSAVAIMAKHALRELKEIPPEEDIGIILSLEGNKLKLSCTE